VEKSGQRQLTDVEASLRSAIQSQNAVTCIFGQNELLHNLRSRGLPASPDIVRRLYDGYGFAAVRKPTHSNFQISAKKQAKTQYLGYAVSGMPKPSPSAVSYLLRFGMVLLRR